MKVATLLLCMLAVLATKVTGKALRDDRKPMLGEVQTLTKDSASNPCVYKGRYVTVDLRKVANQFNGMNVSDPLGKYVYFVSLCSPINCEFSEGERLETPDGVDLGGAAGCQFIKDRSRFVKLGAALQSKFTLFNMTHFSITFSGGEMDEKPLVAREMTVNFIASTTSCSKKATIEFTKEETTSSASGILSNYVFTVNIRMDEQDLFLFNKEVEF